MPSDKTDQESGPKRHASKTPSTAESEGADAPLLSDHDSKPSERRKDGEQECDSGEGPRTWGFFDMLAETRRRHMQAQQAPPVLIPQWIPCEALNSRPKPPTTPSQVPQLDPFGGPPYEQCFVCVASSEGIPPFFVSSEVAVGQQVYGVRGYSIGKAVEVWGIPLVSDSYAEGSVEELWYREYYWRIVVAQIVERETSMAFEVANAIKTAPGMAVRRRICAGGRILLEWKCDGQGWIPVVDTANAFGIPSR